MAKPAPPAPVPVDYNAQASSNQDTAEFQSQLDNPNVVNPYGSTTFTAGDPVFDENSYNTAVSQLQNEMNAYTQSDEYNAFIQSGWDPAQLIRTKFGDRVVNKEDHTRYGRGTMTQSLSESQQKIFDAEQGNKLGLQGLAGQGIDAMKGIVGTAVDYSGAPAAPQQNEELRKKVIDAMMARTGGALTRASEQQDADLIAAGIRPGTEAWDRVKGEQGRNRNDALMQAELAGQGAVESSYGMDDASRRSYIAELLSQRSVPINEITALMSGSQVSNPFSGQGYNAGANVAGVDMNANVNMMNQYNQNAYNQDMAQRNAIIGAAGSWLGGPR